MLHDETRNRLRQRKSSILLLCFDSLGFEVFTLSLDDVFTLPLSIAIIIAGGAKEFPTRLSRDTF